LEKIKNGTGGGIGKRNELERSTLNVDSRDVNVSPAMSGRKLADSKKTIMWGANPHPVNLSKHNETSEENAKTP